MFRFLVLILFLLPLLPLSLSAEGEDPDLAEALLPHWENFEGAKKKYHSALTRGRSYAISKGMIEEVEKIDTALKGEFMGAFENYGTKSAKKTFDYSLGKIAKSLAFSLNKASKNILGEEGGVEKAKELQDTISQIHEAQSVSGTEKKYYCTVYANKDLQEVKDLQVEKGQTLKIYCTGLWAPGKKSQKGDADTYRVMVALNGRRVSSIGKSATLVAERSGTLSFRMSSSAGKKWNRAAADGTMKVTVVPENNSAEKTLESVLEGVLKKASELSGQKPTTADDKKAEPEENGSTKATLRGDSDWQDMGVTVKRGDMITITAKGKWATMNTMKADDEGKVKKRKRKKAARKSSNYVTADELNIQGRIGRELHGQGGESWTFKAKNDGDLFLRMMGYDVLKEFSQPGGSLSLSISVNP